MPNPKNKWAAAKPFAAAHFIFKPPDPIKQTHMPRSVSNIAFTMRLCGTKMPGNLYHIAAGHRIDRLFFITMRSE